MICSFSNDSFHYQLNRSGLCVCDNLILSLSLLLSGCAYCFSIFLYFSLSLFLSFFFIFHSFLNFKVLVFFVSYDGSRLDTPRQVVDLTGARWQRIPVTDLIFHLVSFIKLLERNVPNKNFVEKTGSFSLHSRFQKCLS